MHFAIFKQVSDLSINLMIDADKMRFCRIVYGKKFDFKNEISSRLKLGAGPIAATYPSTFFFTYRQEELPATT